jgi:hypothetical protein
MGSLGLKFRMQKVKAESAAMAQQGLRRPKPQPTMFDNLVGNAYTVMDKIPGFAYADVMSNSFCEKGPKKDKSNRRIYGVAVGLLFVYSLLCYFLSDQPWLGFSSSFTVVFIDVLVYLLEHEQDRFSSGYTVFVLAANRCCLAITGGDYWLVGHSLCYMITGAVFLREIIEERLPMMTEKEAGRRVFFGTETDYSKLWYDVSGEPEFLFGVLTFVYLSLLSAVIFAAPEAASPLVPVFDQLWPSWVFSLLAVIVVVVFGLGNASLRASYLFEKELLSNEWLDTYLFFRGISLPVMLAALTELSIVCAGLLLYGATESTFLVLLSVFAPILIGLVAYVLNQWRSNSCRVVVWPPEEFDAEDFDDEEDDSNEQDTDYYSAELPFELPPLDVLTSDGGGGYDDFSAIKMPALPLKSSLKKRQEEEKKKRDAEDARAAAEAYAERIAQDTLEEEARRQRQLATMSSRAAAQATGGDAGTGTPPEDEDETLVVVKTSTRGFVKAACRSFCVNVTGYIRSCRSTADRYREVAVEGAAKLEAAEKAADETDHADAEADFQSMSMFHAFVDGYLLPEDYRMLAALALLMHLLLLFGVLVSALEQPSYFGNVIWVAGLVLVFSLAPCIKLFYVFEMQRGMRVSLGGAWALMWIGGFVMFGDVYEFDVNREESLVLFMWMWLYPSYLGLAVALLYWQDNNWVWTEDTDRVTKVALLFIAQHVWTQYAFRGFLAGVSCTFVLGLCSFLLVLAKEYATNDRYLSPRFQRLNPKL